MSDPALQIGDDHVVAIRFTAHDDTGTLLESSGDDEPLNYLHGAGNLVPGLEAALVGRRVGDEFEVSLPPAQAFGERSDELVDWLPRENFASVEPLTAGMELALQDDEGNVMPIWIREVETGRVLVDGNHPYSGRTLVYRVSVLGIRTATGEELDHGHPHGGECSHG